MSYGFCRCGEKIVSRTRGIPSVDTCENGHRNDARLTLMYDPKPGREENVQKGSSEGASMPFGFSVLKVVTPTSEGELVLSEYLDKTLRKNEEMKSDPEAGQHKFVSPCPQPTAYQNELLDILIEECAEVIQRATKMKRFGVEEIQAGKSMTNAERLSEELGDVSATVELAEEAGLVSIADIQKRIPIKRAKLEMYIQNTPEAA